MSPESLGDQPESQPPPVDESPPDAGTLEVKRVDHAVELTGGLAALMTLAALVFATTTVGKSESTTLLRVTRRRRSAGNPFEVEEILPNEG